MNCYYNQSLINFDMVCACCLLKVVYPTIVFEEETQKWNHSSEEDFEILKYQSPSSKSFVEMVWNCHFEKILKHFEIEKVEETKAYFEETYLPYIQSGSCKYDKNNPIRKDILLFNSFLPFWYENANQAIVLKLFHDSMDAFCIIIENWFRKIKMLIDKKAEEDMIWQKAIENEKDGICILDKYIPWTKRVGDSDPNLKMIIFKSVRNGYDIVSVDKDHFLVKNSPYLTYLHQSGFMGVASSLENALQAAKVSITVA